MWAHAVSQVPLFGMGERHAQQSLQLQAMVLRFLGREFFGWDVAWETAAIVGVIAALDFVAEADFADSEPGSDEFPCCGFARYVFYEAADGEPWGVMHGLAGAP